MSGVNLLLDTNAIIAILNGHEGAVRLVDGNDLYISFIVELESLSFQKFSAVEYRSIRKFLNECVIIDVNPAIKEKAIFFRTRYGLKLPDAIIAATAFYLDIPLVSADKTFAKIHEVTLIQFSI